MVWYASGVKVGYSCPVCPNIYSYYESTQSQYDDLVHIEATLSDLGLLLPIDEIDPSDNSTFSGKLFQREAKYGVGGFLDDDHKPFVARGVENILHIIPFPFPKTHHKEEDNEQSLDEATTLNMDLIFRCFFCSLNAVDPSKCCPPTSSRAVKL